MIVFYNFVIYVDRLNQFLQYLENVPNITDVPLLEHSNDRYSKKPPPIAGPTLGMLYVTANIFTDSVFKLQFIKVSQKILKV